MQFFKDRSDSGKFTGVGDNASSTILNALHCIVNFPEFRQTPED